MVTTSSQSNKPLIVYKASAGSGKTFTLAVEYIELLIQNPQRYRNILAVTFTNKATEEMKQRILSQLYGIVTGEPDSQSYIERVQRDTGLGEVMIRERASMALSLLLHHYNEFRVETIDAFFQSVFRNLARELNLTANMRVELNDTQIEERAIDDLIEGLDISSPVLQWLMEYIVENIESDKSWNVIYGIKNFGKTIFKDYYKESQDKIQQAYSNPNFHQKYKKMLQEERQQALDYMKQIAETFFDTLDANGLQPVNLKNGARGICSFFNKLRNGELSDKIITTTVANCLENPENWVAKTNPNRKLIVNIVQEELMQILQEAFRSREQQYRRFKSADLTLMHLNQLRLLHSISQKVDELNIEENRFLLSSTQDFLHQLISQDDAPFIFEKIGTQLEHIMIDEFQDTSTVQWRNFKVLLDECLSHTDTRNLIVGDVKQSIYRWRSGDWQLLNNIDQQFDHYDQIAAEPPIDTNYRSLPHIINFNNHFFELAAMTEANDQEEDYPNGARELRHAYQKVIQKWPKDKHNAGMVNIKLLPNDADYDDATLKETAELILQLLAAKVKPGSIAILVRTNSDITKIADYLMQVLPEDVQLVSDQAFRLDASQAVCLLIQALHLLTHSDDRLALASVVKTYQMDILHTQTDLNQWMSTESLYTLLPKEYNGHQEELRAMPLYDLAEHLFHIFQLEKLQSQGAYLCTFFDLLNQFTTDNTADIDLFVQQWDASLCAKTIQSSENKGIRLISIHKSKGLEFDNVIMPYCDWKLEKLNEPIWCKPTEAPYNQLPIVPINFSSSMKGTIYEKDYLMEHLQNCVDNLNLLYVAFTRASQNLFVIGKQKGTNSRSALIEKLLPIMAEKLHADLSEDPMEFTYGDLYVAEDKKEKESHNIFLQKGHDIWPDILSMDNQMEFRQSNQSKDFINNDEDEEAGKMSYIKLGSILHEIFSTTRTHNDIDTALARLEEDGILYDNELTTQRITTMLRKRLENEQIADWFSGKWKLFNECTILQRDNNNDTILNQRPDRVMMKDDEIVIVDFKFAKQKEEHERQVRGYRDLIAGMGYKQTIHCYLWYVYPNKIVEVK